MQGTLLNVTQNALRLFETRMPPGATPYPKAIPVPLKDGTQTAVTLRHGDRQFRIVAYAMTPPRDNAIYADIIMSTTVVQHSLGESVVKFPLLLYKNAKERILHSYFTQQSTENEAVPPDLANLIAGIADCPSR